MKTFGGGVSYSEFKFDDDHEKAVHLEGSTTSPILFSSIATINLLLALPSPA